MFVDWPLFHLRCVYYGYGEPVNGDQHYQDVPNFYVSILLCAVPSYGLCRQRRENCSIPLYMYACFQMRVLQPYYVSLARLK